MYYAQGTISTVSGSAIIRGTGTRFKDNINGVAPAQLILIQSDQGNLIHLIQAVNSDTELVLADNATVTLNAVKYQIQTTLPDSVSDGVRHLVAINAYIIQFLQNMDAWMAQNDVVNVTLPNGQTVALQSIRALYAALAGKLEKSQNGADIPDKAAFVGNLGFMRDVIRQDLANGGVQKIQSGLITNGYLEAADEISCRTDDARMNLKTRDGVPHMVYKWGDPNWHSMNFPRGSGTVLSLGANCWRDNSGYIRQGSPIIIIHPDGTVITNDESEGATVSRLGLGHYRVSGVLGYNADGAWGVHGGISVPRDINGNELVYVEDKVLPDGAIDIKVTHRQNTHMPARLQNRRIKSMEAQTYYTEDEPCDLPAGTRLDVRVQMPEDSVWNVRQGKAGLNQISNGLSNRSKGKG
ncbi:hypothetical protein [Xenorhabdus hominickii]|uniref:Phage tail protein C-terminal domain-containing protein n=1 Tax=Xenorhabdus hominickii TaxID=351679 RepID=A0ABN4S4L3_XENHO|nr:hypothetical protein [Xenorhabdus hominickii]AOM40151.1 hypothetical protein A9255_05895 [Xenorhabdus hominickii]